MKIAGSASLPIPPERAYTLLQDPEALARAIPGCQSLENIGPDEYRMKMKMVLASLSGAFDGTVKIADPNPYTSFRLVVEGSGKIGFVKGDGVLSLEAAEEGTAVTYEGDVSIGGTLASVGQRMIDATAKMLIKRFFSKLVSGAEDQADSESAGS